MDKTTYFLLTFAGVLVLLTIVNLIYFKVSLSLIKYKEKKGLVGAIEDNTDNFSIIQLRSKHSTNPDLHTGNPPLTQPPYPTPPVDPIEHQNVTIRNSHHKHIYDKDNDKKTDHKIHDGNKPIIIIKNKTTDIPEEQIISNNPPLHLGNTTESPLPEPIIPTKPLTPLPKNDAYRDWDDDLFHKKDDEYHFNKTLKVSDPKEANVDGTILENPLAKLEIINIRELTPDSTLNPSEISENKEKM